MPFRLKLGIAFSGILLFMVIIATIIWWGMSNALDRQARLYKFNSALEHNFHQLHNETHAYIVDQKLNQVRAVQKTIKASLNIIENALNDQSLLIEQKKIILNVLQVLKEFEINFLTFEKADIDMRTIKSRMLHESNQLKSKINSLKNAGINTSKINQFISEIIDLEKDYFRTTETILYSKINQKTKTIIAQATIIRNSIDNNSIKLKAYRIANITLVYQRIFNQFAGKVDHQKKASILIQNSLEKSKAEIANFIKIEAKFVQDNVRKIEIVTIVILIIAVIFGILAAFILTRFITKPIKLLKASVKDIESGKYNATVDITSNDEIGDLGKIFNSMSKQLESSFQALDVYKEHLEDKVNIRTRDLEKEIQDRKKTEFELKNEQNLTQSILHWIDSIVMVIDFEGKTILFNKAAEQCSGYKFEEIKDQPFWEFLLLPEEADKVKLILKNVQLGEEGVVMASQNYWLTKNSKRRLLNWHNTLLRRPDGNAKYMLGTGVDITEQKIAEHALQQAHEELEIRVKERTEALNQSMVALKESQNERIRSERIIALGNMVSGVTHEINTPVGVAFTETTFLNEETKIITRDLDTEKLTESQLHNYLKLVLESTMSIYRNLSRASALIGSFKEVASDQASERKRNFNFKQYLNEVLLSLRSKLKQTKHEIIVDCNDDIMINSYPGIFSQIITNFIFNSLIHGFKESERGKIQFKIYIKNGTLFFFYRDNGKGIDEQSLKQIFDPFFTTKRDDGGTGLGLHIVYSLITKKLNGTIDCSSSLGKGVEFFIEIPLNNQVN